MNVKGFTSRAVAGVLLIPLALSAMAPIAEANGWRGKNGGGPPAWGARYKHGGGEWNNNGARYWNGEFRGWSDGGSRGRELHHGSNAGPVIAGIIGGIAIGATLARSSQHDSYRTYQREQCAAPPSYGDRCGARSVSAFSYYDPYCRESFASFDACASHERMSGHPGLIRVINAQTGQCVHSYGYQPGGWMQQGYQAPDDGDGYEAQAPGYYGNGQ